MSYVTCKIISISIDFINFQLFYTVDDDNEIYNDEEAGPIRCV